MSENVAEHPQVVLAEAIAREAHEGATDKIGQPYIEHPRRVAESLEDPIARAAGWLHDVIEDTVIDADELARRGVSADVIEVVLLMTRGDEVPSELYYERLREHPIARSVKVADITDNTLEWRVALLPVEKREKLAMKYSKALEALGE